MIVCVKRKTLQWDGMKNTKLWCGMGWDGIVLYEEYKIVGWDGMMTSE